MWTVPVTWQFLSFEACPGFSMPRSPLPAGSSPGPLSDTQMLSESMPTSSASVILEPFIW